MPTEYKHSRSERGFVLVTALLIMLVLSVIGIATTRNTSIELQIAGNDKIHKKTFYEADAGALLGAEILEQSFNCSTGFSGSGFRDLPNTPPITIRMTAQGTSGGEDLILWNNPEPALADIGDTSKADIAYPIDNLGDGNNTGHLYIGGSTNMLPGGALEMAAGYEGKGKSAAQGGVGKYFNIYSQYDGLIDSQSIILLGWIHVVGSEGTCLY